MARPEYPEYSSVTAAQKVKIVEERGLEIEKSRPAYLVAKEETQGRTDGETVINLARLLKSFQPGDSGEKAIFIVAQAAMIVNKMVMPFAIVRNFEVKEESLKKLRQ